MENLTVKEDYSKSIQALFCTARSSGKHWIFFSAVNVLFSITAILGNALILIALHKESSLHPPSKLLYRCLAITDLLIGLITEPVYAYFFTIEEAKHWLNVCFYSAAVVTVSFTILTSVSLATMTAISVDRLLALLLGVRYRHIVTLRRVRALVILFWIPSITFASMSFWNYMVPKIYNYTIISLCLLVSAICYSKIFLFLRHHQIEVQSHIQQEQPTTGGITMNLARYKKTVSAAVCVLVTLVACYLPYSIVIAIITSQGSSPFLDVCWELTSTLICLNSSLNPVVYCWKIKEVRQEVKNTIKQLLCLSN
ncbi:adenosine receptor A3-like [Oculina patagonica]